MKSQGTKYKKKVALKKLNTEGRFLKTQILSNFSSRVLAYNNLDEAFSLRFKKQLLRACACRSKVFIDDKMKLNGGYSCKTRMCISCNRYRSVKQRLAYAPSIDKIHQRHKKDPKNHGALWFVTLTKPTVGEEGLDEAYLEIQRRWRLLYQWAKKGKRTNFSGIRKLECTANLIKKGYSKGKKRQDYTYHAHLHILIHGRTNAKFIRDEWLSRWPEASIKAQKISKYDGRIGEMLKYIAKPTHSKDVVLTSDYAKAIGWIYYCLVGKRSFFTFGDVCKSSDEEAAKWRVEKEQEDPEVGDILDELTDELRQKIRVDKGWAKEKRFKYTKKLYSYVANGKSLTDKTDINLNNKAHFDPKKMKAIRKFDLSKTGDAQEKKIKQAVVKLVKNERKYRAVLDNLED